MDSPIKTQCATLHFGDGPVSLDEMHNLTDVFMNAIHYAFPGQTIDGRALAAALIASGLGVLRDMGHTDPKDFVHSFTEHVSLADIQPFTPTLSD